MHNWKFWTGVVLVLLALLPTIGIILNPALVFVGPLLVLVAFVGGYLIVGSGMSHGWKLAAGVILFLIAILPSVGFIILPALVFTGPLLVLVAALGGYLVAKPAHGHGI